MPDRSKAPLLPPGDTTEIPPPSADLIEVLVLNAQRDRWLAENCAVTDRAAFGGRELDSLLYDCASTG